MSHNIKLSDDEIDEILRNYRLKKESEKEQEESNIENFSESKRNSKIEKIKELFHKKELSVFPILAVQLLLVSLGVSLLIVAFVGYLDVLINRLDWFLMSFLFFIPFYGMYVKDRFYMKFFENLNIYNGKRDWKNDNFVSAQCTLFSSFTINSFYASLRLFFRKEKPEGHFCNFLLMNGSSKIKSDYFVYILTNDRFDALQTIYSTDVNYANYSVFSKVIEFKNKVPLKITYGKYSHVLRSIAPAEGYSYTEEQLAAIKKFNTLYP